MSSGFWFWASKLLSAITQPVFWLAVWWGCALLLLKRWPGKAVRMLWAGLVFLGLLGFRIFPDAVLRPLELRYTMPPQEVVARCSGLIVLGGAFERHAIFRSHGQVPLGDAAERMTTPLVLLRQFPRMELVFSGGEGRLRSSGITEAEIARVFYRQHGVESDRLHLEGQSRNTRENALRVHDLLGERCGEPWLLVTSAWHMPRAMAEFEKAGVCVIPYPVSFKTPDQTPWTEYALADSLVQWQRALHEWLGLLAVWVRR